jgi:hypothetical protein
MWQPGVTPQERLIPRARGAVAVGLLRVGVRSGPSRLSERWRARFVHKAIARLIGMSWSSQPQSLDARLDSFRG